MDAWEEQTAAKSSRLTIHRCLLAVVFGLPEEVDRVSICLWDNPDEKELSEVCAIPVDGDAQPFLELNQRRVLEVRFCA